MGGLGAQTWRRLGGFHGEIGFPEERLAPRTLGPFLLGLNNRGRAVLMGSAGQLSFKLKGR